MEVPCESSSNFKVVKFNCFNNFTIHNHFHVVMYSCIFSVLFRTNHPRWSEKNVVLKFLQNSQENTCVGVSFLIKLQALDLQLDLKKRIQHRCFPMNNAKFLITVFYRTTSVAASVNSKTLDPRLTTALCISVQGSNRCLGMNQTFTLTRFS